MELFFFLQDYPSIGQLGSKLRGNGIIPLFAVTNDEFNNYFVSYYQTESLEYLSIRQKLTEYISLWYHIKKQCSILFCFCVFFVFFTQTKWYIELTDSSRNYDS